MSEVYFYHLTRQPVDQALRPLLQKSLANGWRIRVRGASEDHLDWLDDKLWLGPEDGFLPHGRSGGPNDSDQPILLCTASDKVDADCLICVEAADVAASDVAACKRVCILFDANDESHMNIARGQWARLTEAGCVAKYWSEESGSWQLKAEKNVSA